jgi:capsular exopolysaccharide synthesis family protein
MLSEKVLYPVVDELKLTEVWGQRFGGGQKLTVDLACDILRARHIMIDSVRATNLIDIQGKSPEPREAAQIANALARSYIAYRRTEESGKMNIGLKNLSDQIEIQRKEVENAKAKVEELRKKYKVDNASSDDGETQLIDIELQRKLAMFDETKADYDARRIRYESIKNRSQDELLNLLPQLGLEDGQLSNIRSQQLSIEAEIAKVLKTGYTEDHPQITSLNSNLQKLKEQISGLIKGKMDALAIDLEVLKDRVTRLETECNQLRDKVRLQKSEVVAPFRDARKESERQQNMLDALVIRLRQEQANTNMEGEPVVLISKAEPNDSPIRPNKTVNFSLSAVVGLVLGLTLAFFIEYLDTSVKTMDDVERNLGIPVLAVIPQGVSPLVHEDANSNHAEGYRILRAKLDLGSREKNFNSITMVSGGPGEGKSTTVFNLAYVCAQSGQSVLLVDADLRRPTLHAILGIKNETGLADVLLGRGQAVDYIRTTSIPNLYLLCAGDMPHAQMGIFSSQLLRDILADLKLRYDLVFCDSPPVLGISDGSVLAQVCDMTLLVIQHRRYPRDISLRAKRAVDEVRGRMVGVVLNAVAVKSDEAYYYYSAYGDYYSSKKTRKAEVENATKKRGRDKKKEESEPMSNGHPDSPKEDSF